MKNAQLMAKRAWKLDDWMHEHDAYCQPLITTPANKFLMYIFKES